MGENTPDDRALRTLEALLECIDELRDKVGADWDEVRGKLFELAARWLREDNRLHTFTTEVRKLLRRYPEARDVLDTYTDAQTRSGALESMIVRSVPRGPRSPFESLESPPSSEAPSRGQVEALVEALRDKLTDPSTVHLNAWFPEHDKGKALGVGRPARLFVNLGPRRGEGAASAAVSNASALYEVDHVDVVVRCAGARISPGSRTLDLPPRGDRWVEFVLTPLRAGALRVAVVLLIQGDPVDRLEFDARADAERAL